VVLDAATFKTVVESTPLVSIDLCLVYEGQLLMGLRHNEPLKGQWFTPGGRLLKNERWQDGLARIAKAELGLTVTSDAFQLMGVWDHFYENSAINESVSTHYVNLPHVCYLESYPELSLDAQHESVRWFDIPSLIKDTGHQIYMREYASWINDYRNTGVGA
jgi:colanic acid biosynthesis protein WcaH